MPASSSTEEVWESDADGVTTITVVAEDPVSVFQMVGWAKLFTITQGPITGANPPYLPGYVEKVVEQKLIHPDAVDAIVALFPGLTP
jgi:hypothetical protein